MAKDPALKVITGKVRLSYVHLNEPYVGANGGDAKYSATLLIPKSDTKTVAAIRKAQKVALEDGKDRVFKGRPPKGNDWDTLRDGDDEDVLEKNPEYAGCWFIGASSKQKVAVVDRGLNLITEPSEIYSGMYARVSMNAFAYYANGNKGISFGLNNVQKLGDAEPFGGFSRPEDDFDAMDDEDEDLLG